MTLKAYTVQHDIVFGGINHPTGTVLRLDTQKNAALIEALTREGKIVDSSKKGKEPES